MNSHQNVRLARQGPLPLCGPAHGKGLGPWCVGSRRVDQTPLGPAANWPVITQGLASLKNRRSSHINILRDGVEVCEVDIAKIRCKVMWQKQASCVFNL
jgi:hypothetical protein